MARKVRHPGSALGEAVGKLIEADLAATVRQVAESFDHSVHSMTLRNHLGNRHQVDTVVSMAKINRSFSLNRSICATRSTIGTRGAVCALPTTASDALIPPSVNQSAC